MLNECKNVGTLMAYHQHTNMEDCIDV